jgi:hypothetical protein
VDLAYPAGTPIDETPSYDRYAKAFDGDVDKIQKCYTPYHHECFDTDCYYDEVFKSYIASSLSHFVSAAATGCRVINCTGGGALEGAGVTCMHFADLLVGGKV